jgi:hypothetical protein
MGAIDSAESMHSCHLRIRPFLDIWKNLARASGFFDESGEIVTLAPGRRRLWVFNLHAELELAHGAKGPYEPALRVKRALAPMLPQARRLMAPGDRDLDDPEPHDDGVPSDRGARAETPGATPAAAAWLGAAWCPTPSALQRLGRAGAEVPPSPAFEVLRRVNHRSFYVALGGGAPGARYVADEAELASTLAEPADAWLFKRSFGFAGRGQRRIVGSPSHDDRRWLFDSLRQGGLVAEPWLELARELAIHGLLEQTGRLALGQPCVQETNAYRAWTGTRLATPSDISGAEWARLVERASTVAEALQRAGYFGPFGIDAYLFTTRSGRYELNPLGELNARYTMGFAIGNPRL